MRILLTGGTGLVGQRLGAELVRRGHQLTVLSRHPDKGKLSYPAQVIKWDGLKGALPGHVIDEAEALVSLAGESIAGKRWSLQEKRRIYDSRVIANQTLHLQLQRRAKPLAVWVSASGAGYYGDCKDQVVNESSPPGSDFLAQVCVDWEDALWQAKDVAERGVALRTGMVISGSGGAMSKLLPVFKYGLGGQLGSGRQWMSWIDIEDLVQLYIIAIENHLASGPINATSPEPVTNLEFTRILGKVLQRPTIFWVPGLALKIGLGEMAQVLLTGQKALPVKAQSLGFKFQASDLESSLRTRLNLS